MPQNATILIVDDDPLHLKIYTWILQREGHHCLTALVGSTSVELPPDEQVDLVLLDYRLNSSLQAPAVARQLQSTYSSVPIVVLSEAPWMPDDMKDLAMAFVNKGNPKLLMETIRSVVERRHSQV